MVKRVALSTLLISSLASAQGLSLTIGNPVAAGTQTGPFMKIRSMVFRLTGCADPATAQIAVAGEGIEPGKSVTIQFRALPSPPGVYALGDQSGSAGSWLAVITATCKSETTAALVPMSGQSFNREGIQALPHAPTKAEIETALKNLPASPASR